MTETSRQIPPGVDLGSDYSVRQAAHEKTEERADICRGLLIKYSQALRERDYYFSKGAGKLYYQQIGVEAKSQKPGLGTEAMKTIEKRMEELQEALDDVIKQLVPYGFSFHYDGFLEKDKCQGFAREFLEADKLAKFRKDIDLSLTQPTIVIDEKPVA